MKTTIVLSQRCFILIVACKIISKTEKKTMSLLSHIGLYYLLYCDYPLNYEIGLIVFHDHLMKRVALQ